MRVAFGRLEDGERSAGARLGVTATEIVLCLLVMGVVIVPLLQMFSAGRKSAAMTEDRILARLVVDSIFSQLEACTFSELADASPLEELVEIPSFEGAVMRGLSVSLSKECPRQGIIVVKAVVDWKDFSGHERRMEEVRFFSDEEASLEDLYPLKQE